jgi:hypothetical protein
MEFTQDSVFLQLSRLFSIVSSLQLAFQVSNKKTIQGTVSGLSDDGATLTKPVLSAFESDNLAVGRLPLSIRRWIPLVRNFGR